MGKMALGFSLEGTPSGRWEILGDVTFLDCAAASHAFQVGHPLNAANDPSYHVTTATIPMGSPNAPGVVLLPSRTSVGSGGLPFVCGGNTVDSYEQGSDGI